MLLYKILFNVSLVYVLYVSLLSTYNFFKTEIEVLKNKELDVLSKILFKFLKLGSFSISVFIIYVIVKEFLK